jgi:hypothetical protein
MMTMAILKPLPPEMLPGRDKRISERRHDD